MIKVIVTECKQITRVRMRRPTTEHSVVHLGKNAQGGDQYQLHARCSKDGHVGELKFSTSRDHNNTHIDELTVPDQHKRKGHGSAMMHALHDWHTGSHGQFGRIQYGFPYNRDGSATNEAFRLEDIPTAGGDLADHQRGGKTPLKVKVRQAMEKVSKIFHAVRGKKKFTPKGDLDKLRYTVDKNYR
jgi:hypothetical protein